MLSIEDKEELDDLLGLVKSLIKLDKSISREIGHIERLTQIDSGFFKFARRKFDPDKITEAQLDQLVNHIMSFLIYEDKLRLIFLRNRDYFERNKNKYPIYVFLGNHIYSILDICKKLLDDVRDLRDTYNSIGSKEFGLYIEILEDTFKDLRVLLVKVEHELSKSRRIIRKKGFLDYNKIVKTNRYQKEFEALDNNLKTKVLQCEKKIQNSPKSEFLHNFIGVGNFRHARFTKGDRILYRMEGSTLVYEAIVKKQDHDKIKVIAEGLS